MADAADGAVGGLNDEVGQGREQIAAGANERRYAPDEIIVREGDGTSSMFVIATGRAGVSIHGVRGWVRLHQRYQILVEIGHVGHCRSVGTY